MAHLPEEIAARLGRPMPWWKLLDCPELSEEPAITREASSFAQRLSKFRIAVVPDPRIDAGGIAGDTPCIAFRVSACMRHVTHDYEPAKRQLERDLAFLMVKGKPSPRELNWVKGRGLEQFRLDGETRERLLNWLDLRLNEPIEAPEDVVRAIGADRSIPWRGDQYARYLALCEADGVLTNAEREALKLVKQDKGIPARRQLSIFEQPEQSSTADNDPPATLVTPVVAPKLQQQKKPQTLALMLNEELIASIKSETTAVDGLLGEVFKEEAAPAPGAGRQQGPAAPKDTKAGWRDAFTVVVEQVSWEQDSLEARWRALGLMPQAIHDDLNERALDACGELLLEGDGTLDVNALAVTALQETL